MDLVTVMADAPAPGEMVGMIFADDEGGMPEEVVGRVIAAHGDLIGVLSGAAMTVTWNQQVAFPLAVEDD